MTSLARLAPTDDVAAQALLWLVAPAVIQLAGRMPRSRTVDDLLALAWESIRTSRPSRNGPVLTAICSNVRTGHRRLRTIENPRRSVPFDDREDRLAGRSFVNVPSDPVLDGPVTIALRAACSEKAIGADDYRVVVRTRICGEPLDVFAAEEGVTSGTLARRGAAPSRYCGTG